MNEKTENPKSNWCCHPFYIYSKDDVSNFSLALEDGCKKNSPGLFI